MPDQSPGSNNDEEDDDDSSTCHPDDYVPETQPPPELILVPSPVRHLSQQRYPLRSTPEQQQQQDT